VSEESLRQVRLLAEHVDLGLGDSDFNRRELAEMGYRTTRMLPILFDPGRYSEKPDAGMAKRLAGRPAVLSVGRIVPNKAPDDFIRAAAAYSELEGAPPARFVIAGKRNALPAYAERIEALLEETGLDDERLLITGEISQAELIAAYRSASVFLTLSRHEGFCVPILESWLFGVPVLALANTAVPETLGDAGLLIGSAEPVSVARHIERLLTDERLRADLIGQGRARLARYDIRNWGFVLRTMLEELCG
jgi:glycosyltransferase involved in cell wall biosynthesis